MIILPAENAINSGHPDPKPAPGKSIKYGEKRTIIRKSGRVNVVVHLVVSLNIDSSFCISPLLWSSAIVGAKTLLIELNGKAIKPPNLIADPYCPIATSAIPKTANRIVSIESNIVSTIVVKKLSEAKVSHSRTSYRSGSGVAKRENSRKRKYKLSKVLNSVPIK